MNHDLSVRDEGYTAWYQPKSNPNAQLVSVLQGLSNFRSVEINNQTRISIFRTLKGNEVPSFYVKISAKFHEEYKADYANKTSDTYKSKAKDMEEKVSYFCCL